MIETESVDWQDVRSTLGQLDLRLRLTIEEHRDVLAARAANQRAGDLPDLPDSRLHQGHPERHCA